MNFETDKVIGVVGGMGPQAGTDLLNHIFRLTKATKDQHHHSVILMSFPKHIEDRTDFVEGKIRVNPAHAIVQVVLKLEAAGAAVAGMACNTSHIPEIYDVILRELERMRCNIKLLHMPFETCKHIRNQYPTMQRVGVMCTNGTYKSGIYQRILKEMNLVAVVPELEFQNEVIHKMIYHPHYGIKACVNGVTREVMLLLDQALVFFEERGVDVIILGCTELSLVFRKQYERGILIVNSNEVLAGCLIKEVEQTIEVIL